MQVGEQAVLRCLQVPVSAAMVQRFGIRCAPEMAYGKDGNDVIPAQSTLVFEIEVLGWEDSNSVGGCAFSSLNLSLHLSDMCAVGGPDVMGLLIAGMVVLACAAPFLRDYL